MRYLIRVATSALGLIAMTLVTQSVALAQSSTSNPVVIELFTSQGCSSCPPADALLGELANRPDVIALAFHVPYWDTVGWQDRFAVSAGQTRQENYAERLRLGSVFTPQMIVSGSKSIVGGDRRSVVAALAEPHEGMPIRATVLDGELTVSLDARPDLGPLEVSAVGFLSEASTPVGRGENAGRILKEFNIVRAVKHLGTWKGTASNFTLRLSSLPADVSGVAILAQQAGQGHIAGATKVLLR
jgi:hypothetical protein